MLLVAVAHVWVCSEAVGYMVGEAQLFLSYTDLILKLLDTPNPPAGHDASTTATVRCRLYVCRVLIAILVTPTGLTSYT